MLDIVWASSGDGDQPRYWLVYLLFILAGLLVGGAYSAYQSGSKKATYFFAVLAALALAAGLTWLIGEMT